MAASLLTAMWRFRLSCAPHSSILGCRGLITRPPVDLIPGDHDEQESDVEENLEQEIKSALKRQKKAILLKRMKREMGPPEPTERRLTWNAIQQIRYLSQEFPEEWPMSRLAVGFNVSNDTIKKVLMSKFIPSEARKMKQDSSVFRVLGQNAPGATNVRPQLGSSSKDTAQPLLPLQGDSRQLLVSHSSQRLPPPKRSDSSALAVRPAHLMETPSQGSVQGAFGAGSSQGVNTSTQAEPEQTMEEEDGRVLDEKWDGEVLSDKDLEELADTGSPNNTKVVQKGQEFFDGDGNFLYRI